MRQGGLGSWCWSLCIVVCACSFDTRPALLSGPPQSAAPDPVVVLGVAGRSAPDDTGAAGSADPPQEPRDPSSATAGAGGDVGTPAEPFVPNDATAGASGAGGEPAAAAGAPAPGGSAAPPTDGSSLIDDLRDLIARNPRVQEAAALRRIMDAMSGTPPDVPDAVDALGDVDCRRNERTCVGVCTWAASNCRYCESDPVCMSDLQQNCRLGCR
jgi:hypothetical protein